MTKRRPPILRAIKWILKVRRPGERGCITDIKIAVGRDMFNARLRVRNRMKGRRIKLGSRFENNFGGVKVEEMRRKPGAD